MDGPGKLMLHPQLTLVLASSAVLVDATNFTFTYSQPKACDQLTINWNGGEPPFSLLLTPAFNQSSLPMNVSIPNDASNTFSTTLPFDEGTEFVITMSDNNGFATGGTTPILTPVSTGNNSCQNDTLEPAFFFSVPDSLVQCG